MPDGGGCLGAALLKRLRMGSHAGVPLVSWPWCYSDPSKHLDRDSADDANFSGAQ